MSKNNKKIVVGMSGGVDSSMSLVLLKKQGWNPVPALSASAILNLKSCYPRPVCRIIQV